MFLFAFSVDIPCTLAVLLLLEREKDEMPLLLSCYSDPFDLVIHSKFRGTHTYVTLRVRRIKVERKWGKKTKLIDFGMDAFYSTVFMLDHTI
jgi:hypothetical protein